MERELDNLRSKLSTVEEAREVNYVFKNDEFGIKNDEFGIKNDEFCIKNDEFCTKDDEFCI